MPIPAGAPAADTLEVGVEMLTDMTPTAGQLYPQLQSIAKSPVHGHVVSLRYFFFFFSRFVLNVVCASVSGSVFPRRSRGTSSARIEYRNLPLIIDV